MIHIISITIYYDVMQQIRLSTFEKKITSIIYYTSQYTFEK